MEIGGAGWLVHFADTDRWLYRFDPDSGGGATYDVCRMHVGRPSDCTRDGTIRKGASAAADYWFTMDLRSGATVCYYREDRPPPPDEAPVPEKAPRPGKTNVIPSGSFPPPNATRAADRCMA